MRGSSRLRTPSSWYFVKQGIEHGAGLRAVLGEDVALPDVLGALAAGERRAVEGTWQIRSKGSRSLPTSSASGSSGRPSASSSSMMACLRSAAFQRCRKSSRLAKRFLQGLLGEVAQALGDELAVLVEIFDALGDDGGADAIDVDLLALLAAVGRDGDVGRLAIDDDVSSSPGSAGSGRRRRRRAARRRAG